MKRDETNIGLRLIFDAIIEQVKLKKETSGHHLDKLELLEECKHVILKLLALYRGGF